MPETSHHPSVGVIVLNHTRVETLPEALQSIEAQDYEGEINVYLVYREIPEMAGILSRLGPRVTAIPTSAMDPGGKRNVGLDKATEDLVAFIDDDDFWHPAKVRRQVEALVNSAAAACCTRYVSFTRVPFEWPAGEGVAAVRPVSEREIAFSSTIAMSSSICDGEILRNLRFTERPEWRGVDDLDLWLRVHEHGQIVCLEERLTAIRIHHGSLGARGRITPELRGLNVIADRRRDGKRGWVSAIGLARRTIDSAIARPGADADKDLDLLLKSYDGSLVGRRADRMVVALVRASWRSRAIVPILRWIRRQEYRIRLALMPKPPMKFTDTTAREGQWGRDGKAG